VRKADNLAPSCAVVTKSGKLNFLEPSDSVQARNGTDLPFYRISPYNRYEFVINGTCYEAVRLTQKRYTGRGFVIDRNCLLLRSVLLRDRKIPRNTALGMFMIRIISARL